ncbi:MAG: tyrosine-protein phosphatase [Bacillota bacterium]
MIDIHCHVLHGIDDGPGTLEESLELCRKLQQRGVSGIIATPHFIGCESYMPLPEDIKYKVSLLQEEIHKEGIDIEIYPGMEVFASHDTAMKIQSGEILSLNNSRYVLVEFSFEIIPKYASNLLFSMQVEGLVPIIAHPERYCSDYRKSELLDELVDNGALIQINAGSILGKHGKKARKEAIRLIRAGMVHFIASDSHGGRRVMSDKNEVEKRLARICGAENAERLMYINPLRVVENKDIERMTSVKRSFFLGGLFRNLKFNV